MDTIFLTYRYAFFNDLDIFIRQPVQLIYHPKRDLPPMMARRKV